MTSQPDPTRGGAAPTCPRHPGVVSYVRCTRCERPACPACQRPAAVGVQCVDCVREGARTVRQPTGRFGGAVTTDATPVTLGIIGACVLVYVVQTVYPAFSDEIAFAPVVGYHEPWRFLTAAFAHASTTHILFNMLALWQVGTGLEHVLGRWRYVALYLLSALAGSVGYLLLSSPPSPVNPLGSHWYQGTVGASGAVFGLFGAYLVLARRAGLDVRGMLGWLAVNVVIGFVVPGIAWQAHLGGFVAGAAFAGILVATRERSRRRLQWPALALLLVVLVGLAVARYAVSPAAALLVR